MRRIIGAAMVMLVAILAFSGAALAKESPLTFGAQIPINIPISHLSDVAGVGLGIQVAAGYEVTENIVPKLTLGFLHHFEKATVSTNIIPVLAGIDVYFGKGHLQPVVGGDLGLNYMMASSSLNSAYTSSEAKFGFDINGGVKYELSHKLDLTGKLVFGTYSLGDFGDTLFLGIQLGGDFDL